MARIRPLRDAGIPLLRALLGLAVPCLVLAASTRAQQPPLAAILEAAGKYVETYEQAFSAVVSEERYMQVVTGPAAGRGRQQRSLKSDVLLVAGKEGSWITFRDVFEVDGARVRDRDDRLAALILKPSSDSFEQFKRIAEEGARFNIGPINRTVNTPALALSFLRPSVQPRLKFEFVKMSRVNGTPAAEIRFHEHAQPRLVKTHDGAAAIGRFWIEPGTGAVLKSEFGMTSVGTRATITVTYEMEKKAAMLVPTEMAEFYEIDPRIRGESTSGTNTSTAEIIPGRIEGHATYANFRKFNVDTSTIIK